MRESDNANRLKTNYQDNPYDHYSRTSWDAFWFLGKEGQSCDAVCEQVDADCIVNVRKLLLKSVYMGVMEHLINALSSR